MKLVRYGLPGQERPGVLDRSGKIRDLGNTVRDLAGVELLPSALQGLATQDLSALPVVEGTPRLGPCVGFVSKVIGVGFNYANHIQETSAKTLKEPLIFQKATSAISGPNDPIVIPRNSQKTDWEVELGVVIGRTAKYVQKEEALQYVAGYCVLNDVSEREFQVERSGQYTKGKSCDTFCPIGPWLVTSDEIPDPQKLDLFCEINGRRTQSSNTANMSYDVASLVSYISQFMRLLPGDIIATGTPEGVGFGMKPPMYLKAGDRLRCSVAGMGEQNHEVIAEA